MVRISPCQQQHRDLRLWNRQKSECCLSCGSFHTNISDIHAPLKFSDEIRLLRLLPSKGDSEDLMGELIHVRLQDNPIYEAVSYTWADESGVTRHSGNLFVKSRDGLMKITNNCEAMLRKFRDEQHTRLLWVDSICIDQDNTLERSEQVQMMTSIYKQAHNVLAFLGNPPEDHYDDYREFFDYVGAAKYCSWASMGPIHDIFSDDSTDDSTKQRLWKTVVDFFGHSWFHRIWIVQEVIMAQQITLYFGTFVINWEDISLHRVAPSLSRGEPRGRVVGYNSGATTPLEAAFEIDIPPVLRLKKGTRSEGARLIELLSATRSCAATDPRDKIFALLGIAKAENKLQLPSADYTKSIADVFTEAAIYCVRSTSTLDILSSIQSPFRMTISWVPDFSHALRLTPLPKGREHISDEQNKRLDLWAYEHCKEPIIPGSREVEVAFLNVTGLLLDVITCVQNDQEQILGAISRRDPTKIDDFISSFQRLFQAPPTHHVPSILLHCPLDHDHDQLPFIEPSPGVDPDDLLAIDLLAPFHERRESSAKTKGYSPYCASIFALFYNSILEYGCGRSVSCGVDTLGIVPAGTQSGDSIWMLSTASHPMVLRRHTGSNFLVIGPCMIISPSTFSGCKEPDYHRKRKCDCGSCSSHNRYVNMTNIYGISII